jgi:amino acid transporter/predicted flap endonuclease-1-like 5' DNA nuclease
MTDNRHLSEDERVLHGMGYAQELSRRMGPFQSFAISFAIICIISGGFGSFPIALSSGGPFALTIGWLIGGAYALIIAASLGQIASAYPTAGSLYHWSSILGGRFWGWATAYVNLLGLLFVIPAVNVFLYFITKDLLCAGLLGWNVSEWGTWTQIWFVVAMTAAQAALNHFGIGLTSRLTDIAGYLILAVTVVLIIMFASSAVDFSLNRAFEFTNNTGAAGGGVVASEGNWLTAFLIGLLYPLFTITGFDASAHTAEETVNARDTVHKGMISSVFWSLVFGFVLILFMVLAIPDLKVAAAEGWSSFNNLFMRVIMGSFIGNLMLIGVIIANFLCALAALTSTSRMIYAFARDGGLPFSSLLSSVSPVHRTPNAAIWFTFVLCSILIMVTTPLGAFAALSTGCAVYLYISYAMPIVAGFFAEGKTWTEFGKFRLGGLSKLFGIITMIGTVAIIYAGHRFVASIPADPAAGTGFIPGLIWYSLGFLAFLLLIWFGIENRRFKGPPMGEEIKRRQADIAAREAAITGGSTVTSSYGGTDSLTSNRTSVSGTTPLKATGAAVAVASGAAALAAKASDSDAQREAELKRQAAAKAEADRVEAERQASLRVEAERKAQERIAKAKAEAEARAAADAQVSAASGNEGRAVAFSASGRVEADSVKSKSALAAGNVDDIIRVDGIGPELKKMLAAEGLHNLADLANLSDSEIDALDAKIPRDAEQIADWRKQAKDMLAGKAPRAKIDRDGSSGLSSSSSVRSAKKAKISGKPAAKSSKAATSRRADNTVDDITLVDGIGPQLQKLLATEGIRSLRDLSKLSASAITSLDSKIPRDADQISDWVKQAKDLLAGKAPRAKSDRNRKKT